MIASYISGVEGGAGWVILEGARRTRSALGVDRGYVGSGGSGKGAICVSNWYRSDFSTGCGERSHLPLIEETLSGYEYVVPSEDCSGFNGYTS